MLEKILMDCWTPCGVVDFIKAFEDMNCAQLLTLERAENYTSPRYTLTFRVFMRTLEDVVFPEMDYQLNTLEEL